MNGIRISEKHGVNPMLLLCAVCGEDAGVALLGKLKDDAKAPRQGSDGRTLCTSCEGVLKKGGGLLIEVKDKTGGWSKDPERTGQVWGLKKEAFDRLNVADGKRVAYIDQTTAKQLGLKEAA